MSLRSLFIFFAIVFHFASCKQNETEVLQEAHDCYSNKQYNEAIKLYSQVLKQNRKNQPAYYNRGLSYSDLKQYSKALADFNSIISLQTHGNYIVKLNEELPYAEAKTQIPYNDALYQRAIVKAEMDSIKSSFLDFQTLIENKYSEASNCLLWQGILWIKIKEPEKACDYFRKAKERALSNNESLEADRMINSYCQMPNNNR